MQALRKVVTQSFVPRFNFSNQLGAGALSQIQASIPLLEAQGNDVCDYFYKEIIYPQNLPFFNKRNIQTGAQTSSLNQFLQLLAKRADNLETMHVHLNRISAKHTGFGIQKELYPIFAGGIVKALEAVLKEKATPELLAAWTELISDVAKGLQENEAANYDKLENSIGGWTGARKFNVFKREELANGVISLYVKSEDGQPIMKHKSGQYVTIKINTPAGVQYRPLTICNSPGRDYYRVTVKSPGLIADILAKDTQIGDSIELLAPNGNFSLQGHFNDVVLIGTGIATSALFQIANAAKNRQVYYIQVAKNEKEYLMKEAVEQLKKENSKFQALSILTDSNETLTKEVLQKFAPTANADFYFTAQDPAFVKNVVSILKSCDVKPKNAFYEFDGPYQFLMN